MELTFLEKAKAVGEADIVVGEETGKINFEYGKFEKFTRDPSGNVK